MVYFHKLWTNEKKKMTQAIHKRRWRHWGPLARHRLLGFTRLCFGQTNNNRGNSAKIPSFLLLLHFLVTLHTSNIKKKWIVMAPIRQKRPIRQEREGRKKAKPSIPKFVTSFNFQSIKKSYTKEILNSISKVIDKETKKTLNFNEKKKRFFASLEKKFRYTITLKAPSFEGPKLCTYMCTAGPWRGCCSCCPGSHELE